MQGVLVFVHGFAQYPDAYMQLLYALADRNKIVILAPETGILAPYVWKQFLSNFVVSGTKKKPRGGDRS